MSKPNNNDPVTVLPEHVREVFAKATCLHSRAEVDVALDRMAAEISYQLSHTNPVFLCVVIGGIVTVGHLLTRLNFPLEVDYIHITRYRKGLTGHDIEWKAKPECQLAGRTVVVVDDILDGGVTLDAVMQFCKESGASAAYSAVLVDKENARLPGGVPKADFVGLAVDNHYVFGYGMDYKGYLRNAPGIYRVAEEHEK